MCILDMKEVVSTSELDAEEKSFCNFDMLDNSNELRNASNEELFRTVDSNNVPKESVSVVKCASFDYYADSYCLSRNITNSRSQMLSDKRLQSYSLAQNHKYIKKTLLELQSYSVKRLQILFDDLSRTVEAVSGELVQLLLENDSLQQESDARNVAIEQLLKMTVKSTDGESRPIQMSVVLPSDKENADDAIKDS